MVDNQLYPFERNRYYTGKMLTSADFRAEQTYFNNKRRFINNLMYGTGIVCGCGVFSLDDLSVLVESGVAIDGAGREIVLESSVVKKLSAIDGFEELKTEHVSLCVRYRESETQSVYAVNQRESGQEYEYNRISEGYQLFLADTEELSDTYEMENEFLVCGELLESEDFHVELVIPGTVCKGRNVRFLIRITKKSPKDKRLSYYATLQAPAFLFPSGGHETEICLEDITLQEGGTIEREYWMTVSKQAGSDTELIVKSGSVRALAEEEAVTAEEGISLKLMLADCHPRELVSREIGRMSLEMRSAGADGDFIRLADLRLVRTENAYIIEEVNEIGIKKYISAPAQELLRESYLDYFRKEAGNAATPSKIIQCEEPVHNPPHMPQMATGILEIPLGINAKRGDINYSGEIMHGLGRGNVYVEVGYEYIVDQPTEGTSTRNTIYGSPKLFRQEEVQDVDAETAVKVLNDKGSFIVAAKLLKNVDYLFLTYRWVAVRFPTGEDMEPEESSAGMSIYVETPTVILGTRESHFFSVKYHNMESCSLGYELTEPGSGEITMDGIYTAPAKEGIYEIRIYCTDRPFICTYAYAIVKKKGYEED